ncbi:MAG: hypothetical protein HRT41_00025 [Campylobacteraceae bacterium]|nr:hypothetical protein [Campylobacteraceae bacterium]
MRKIFLLTLLLVTYSLAEQVSAFGAGNLNSKNPYGLTNTEKHILTNKKKLGSIDSKVKDVKSTVTSVNQRLDGLESIYEGDSAKLNRTVIKLNNLVLDLNTTKEVSQQILTIQEEMSAENLKNIEALKLAISELTKSVNKINANYISEREFRKNMKQFITKKEFLAFKKSLGKKTSSKIKAKTLNTNDKKGMMVKAKALFKIDHFTKAIPMFESLVAAKYKPAENNFYLGEIWYYRKKYDDAIRHYKISATLYDKASYMPKLLLHSAISFEKVNDLDNAANFYSTLIDVYPESKEAKIAYKNLSTIN